MLRPDFFDLVSYAVERRVGMKFSSNGTRLTPAPTRRLAALDYLDVQDQHRQGHRRHQRRRPQRGLLAAARTAVDNLASAGFGPFKISVIVARAERGGARRAGRHRGLLRRPAAADASASLGPRRGHLGRVQPTAAQQRALYHWLLERPSVLTADSFFHLSAVGRAHSTG